LQNSFRFQSAKALRKHRVTQSWNRGPDVGVAMSSGENCLQYWAAPAASYQLNRAMES
jgi:hypothetical protein